MTSFTVLVLTAFGWQFETYESRADFEAINPTTELHMECNTDREARGCVDFVKLTQKTLKEI